MSYLRALTETRPEGERALNSRLQIALREMGFPVVSEQSVPPATFVNQMTGTLLVTNGIADLVVETHPGIFTVVECKRALSNLDSPARDNPLRQLGDYLAAFRAEFPETDGFFFRGELVALTVPDGCPKRIDGIGIHDERGFLREMAKHVDVAVIYG